MDVGIKSQCLDLVVSRNFDSGIEFIRHEDESAGEFWALLIHGAGGNADQFNTLQEQLSGKNINSTAISLSNHGQTKASQGRVGDYMADVRKAVQLYGLPSLILGHSLGGYIAQLLHHEVASDDVILLGSIPPDALDHQELQTAVRGLKTEHAQLILKKALSIRPAKLQSNSGCIHIIGGKFDRVIPPALVERTAKHYDADHLMLDCGHDLLTGAACEDISSLIHSVKSKKSKRYALS